MGQHKTSSAQQALASHLLTPPVTPVSTAWEQQRRSVIEAKASQPAFPGQPPPLQDVRRVESSSPAFPGQPPPRQSSQPRSQVFLGSLLPREFWSRVRKQLQSGCSFPLSSKLQQRA